MFGWIEKIKVFITNKYLSSTIRRLLDVVGAWLVMSGVDEKTASDFENISMKVIEGLLTILVSQLWSWVDKQRNAK
jgi:hypothetical protein